MLSFNQVNGVPRDFELPGSPGFRYVEVWPPNDRWRHLEGLLARSSPAQARRVLAIYPPVWSAERAPALRTALLTEAVATTLGASLLVWGDDRGCLQHPYYVDHEQADGGRGRAGAALASATRCAAGTCSPTAPTPAGPTSATRTAQ